MELLDRDCGRDVLVAMLAATRTAELLDLAGTTEAELLAAWREAQLGGRESR